VHKLITLLLPLLLLISAGTLSAGPMQEFVFEDAEQEEVFKRLRHEIRCLVCQNQSIGDSNAGLAKDLREEIYDMLKKGMSEQEIIDFLVQRYGDFVLYDPPMKPMTWMLWFGPLLIFFIALFYALRFVRSHLASDGVAPVVDDADLDRLKNLQAEASQNNNEDKG